MLSERVYYELHSGVSSFPGGFRPRIDVARHRCFLSEQTTEQYSPPFMYSLNLRGDCEVAWGLPRSRAHGTEHLRAVRGSSIGMPAEGLPAFHLFREGEVSAALAAYFTAIVRRGSWLVPGGSGLKERCCTMAGCLTDHDLHQFHSGEIESAVADVVQRHLDTCSNCASRSAALIAAQDRLLLQAREVRRQPLPTAATPPRQIRVNAGAVPVPIESPEQIGAYKLLEVLGEGGLGTVWLAQQEQPVRRRVALKVIKAGMDTREVVRRFEAERQALALMDHPNVAKVFDGGATPQGRPYFVMEYVAGEPITTYCDRNKLAMTDRLELFIGICEAVQHAHLKGIIHRDIKPTNVLVSVRDGKPTPKVIDFGVAKATNQRLTEHTIYTEHGLLIGTPEYMSPEQAEMGATDVDTRTDIYSLGVLLYELLTGALPFDSQNLRRAGYAEIQRIIREVDPPKPSTKLSSLRQAKTASSTIVQVAVNADGGKPDPAKPSTVVEVADRRRTDVRTLLRQLRGDLDWVVMKCIEKDRTRRYESAGELAMEIRRFLRNEPVNAGPPSIGYRCRKFLRRNRTAVIAVSAIAMFSIASLAAVRSSHKARQREQEAKALRIEGFVRQGVEHRANRDWESAARMFRAALAEDPDCYRALVNLVAVQRFRFEDQIPAAVLDECVSLLDRALALEPDRAEAWNARGVFLRMSGKYDEAIDSHRRGIRANESFYANWASVASVYALRNQLDEAEKHLQQACALEGAAGDGMPWHNLAAVLLQLGKTDAAIESLERAKRIKSADVPTILLQARVHLVRRTTEDLRLAYRAAITADGLNEGEKKNPRVARILALTELANGQWSEAIAAAQRASAAGDTPIWPLLVRAVAHSRLGNTHEAQKLVNEAREAWPAEYDDSETVVRLDQGLLWFESVSDARSLLQEVDRGGIAEP